jgi:DCN1-like protein 1/2
MWSLYIPPALKSRPSALSKLLPGESATSTSSAIPPDFTMDDFELWLEFQKEKGKAVSKDTWSLFVDFIRTIDEEFKAYDEEGELV